MVPVLQIGIPGGLELLVILFIMVLVFGVPLALIAGGILLYRRGSSGRVEKLEERIDDLEQELERERRGSDDGGND